MGTYSVVALDGQMYGPADETTLVQWAREGRIDARTTLHSHETGQRVWAQSVPSLMPILDSPQRAVNSTFQPQMPLPQPMTDGGASPAGLQYANLQYANPMTANAGHSLDRFPVAGVIALTFCTMGIFPWIHFGLMHDKLPRNRPDDPSSLKAILFHMIPFFNLYWMFFERLRLMDRIDEQRRLVGLPPAGPKGFYIATSCMMFVPFVNYISILVLAPIVIGLCQSQVNGLVDATRGVR